MRKSAILFLWHHIFKYVVFFCDFCYRLCTSSFQIASKEETICEIIDKKCSICRFGDGEFRILMGEDIEFQKYEKKLGEKLFAVLKDTHEDVLVGLPDTFSGYNRFEKFDRNWWMLYMCKNRYKLYQILDRKKYYYNANISRPYMIYKNKGEAPQIFNLLKSIWNDRNVIIVEGEQSRLGINNDLLNNSKSIRRILCPIINAFSKYQEIQDYVKKIYQTGDLVIIALGPTATVLALDLHLWGIQALDIGHVDIEYSWMNMGASEKVPVLGKYTNEAGCNGGSCMDPQYLKEIVEIIK